MSLFLLILISIDQIRPKLQLTGYCIIYKHAGRHTKIMKTLEKLGEEIYIVDLISKRLAARIMKTVMLLETKKPNGDAVKNQFTTYSISDSANVGGIRLATILQAIYKRLTYQYFINTGIGLKIPVFPNESCTIKSQVQGQSHEAHTDGGAINGDYGIGNILHSSILCLNGEYEGGHTQFYLTGTMDEPNIDIDVKLMAGQALIFNADLNYHGVTEVTAGARYSLIQFWRE